jgi:hypothetical protein
MTAYAPVAYTGDGSTTDYLVPFTYLSQTHVKAALNGSVTTAFHVALGVHDQVRHGSRERGPYPHLPRLRQRRRDDLLLGATSAGPISTAQRSIPSSSPRRSEPARSA